jgi:hypothetical protein
LASRINTIDTKAAIKHSPRTRHMAGKAIAYSFGGNKDVNAFGDDDTNG